MSFVLANVTTADAYTDANTLDGMPSIAKIIVDVANAGIMWSIKQNLSDISVRGSEFGAEVPMFPGSKTIVRRHVTGIRVRSLVAGKPAQVTVEAVPFIESA